MQGKEVLEVDVGLVEKGDLSVTEVGAEGGCAGVVVVGGFLDDGAGGQKCLEVEAQVELGSGLAAAVLRP